MRHFSHVLPAWARFDRLWIAPAILLLGASVASAQTYTYTGASGSSWNIPGNWSSSTVPDSASVIAAFDPSTAQTVNLGTTPETVEGLSNSGSTTTISGSGAGVLTLQTSGSTPSILATKTLIITAPIAGTQGISIGTSSSVNSGLVYFNTPAASPNTFTGGLTIDTSAGSGLVAYYIADIPSSNTITIASGNLEIGYTATSQTWSNNVVASATTSGINAEGGTQTLSGSITGTGGVSFGATTTTSAGFDVTGTGNNYSGATSIATASFLFNGNSTIGTGQLNFGTATASNAVFVYNTGVTDDITQNSAGNTRVVSFVASSVTTPSTYINTNGNNVTWSNPITSTGTTGTNGLTKTGSGSLTLGSSETGFTDPITVAAETSVTNLGTTASGGTLIGTGATDAFGNGGALTVGAFGTLQLNSGATASNSSLGLVNNAQLNFTLGTSPSLLTLSGAMSGTSLTAGGLTLDLLAGAGIQGNLVYTLANYGSTAGITYSDLTVVNNTGLSLDTGYGTDGVNIGSTSLTVEFSPSSVPEPPAAALLLLSGALFGANFLRRRFRIA